MIATMVWAMSEGTVHAQEMTVALDVQYPLLMKVLSADHRLRERVGGQIVIGVVYQRKFRESVRTLEELQDLIRKNPISPLPEIAVSLIPIAIEDGVDFEAEIAKAGVNVCYFAPLRAIDVKPLVTAASSRKMVTCTGVLEYMDLGVSVGIGLKGGRPELLINLVVAKAVGVDFSSQVLKLARIISSG